MREDKKRFLVLGINCFPELTGIGKYTGEMVNWLAKENNEVTMVTGFPYYPYWKVQKPYSGKWYKKEQYHNNCLSIYRCPMYIPKKPSGLKRLIHEGTFHVAAFFVVLRLLFKKKHDYIFCIAPPFHLGFLGLFYRFFKGGKLLYHIQDLQVDAAKQLKILKPSWIFSLLFGAEKLILKYANFVSTIAVGMQKRIAIKINKPILLFPNWVDTELFYPLTDRNALKQKWQFNLTDKIILYSGSIGEKQGLEVLLTIASEILNYSYIKIVICGTGPYKDELMKMSAKAKLSNVVFLPLQPKDQFNEFLNMADVHLVLQKGNASDLVMPSKLTTILSAGGLALITADEGTTLHDLVKQYGFGIVIPAENKEQLLASIMDCSIHAHESKRIEARNYALHFLRKEYILTNLLKNIRN